MLRYLRKPRRWIWSTISLFLCLVSFMIHFLQAGLHWQTSPFGCSWGVIDALYLASILVALAALVPAVLGVVVGRPKWLGIIAIVAAVLSVVVNWSLVT